MEIGKILDDGTVEKEYYGQGFIYKNEENFEKSERFGHAINVGICYISEYGTDNVKENDDFETYDSMKKQVEEAYKEYTINPLIYPIEKMVKVVFEMLDWQGFSTLLYETIDCLPDECFL